MNMVEARIAMVDNQIRPADVTRYEVLAAFLDTKQEAFLPVEKKFQAYGEYEIAIGADRAMMTPRSFAKLVSAAAIQSSDEVLLIGGNYGYEAAILAQLAAMVIVVEADRKLASAAQKHLSDEGYDNAVLIGGSLQNGAKKSGPYDVIIFSGAIGCVPKAIAGQLKPGGRVVAIFDEGGVFTAKSLFSHSNSAGEELVSRNHFQASAPILPGFQQKAEFTF